MSSGKRYTKFAAFEWMLQLLFEIPLIVGSVNRYVLFRKTCFQSVQHLPKLILQIVSPSVYQRLWVIQRKAALPML
jgi:hypothetical protein